MKGRGEGTPRYADPSVRQIERADVGAAPPPDAHDALPCPAATPEDEAGWASAAPMPGERLPFGVLALQSGKATTDEIDRALEIQEQWGGRLGGVLAALGVLNYLDVAEILAEQEGLPFVDLLGRETTVDERLCSLMSEAFWRTRSLVPLAELEGILTVAMEDPSDSASLQILRAETGREVRAVVTGRRDIAAVLEGIYGREYLEESRVGLDAHRPDESASRLLTPGQIASGGAIVAVLAVGLALRSLVTAVWLSALVQLFYSFVIAFKMVLIRDPSERKLEADVTPEEIAALDEPGLPAYTVIVPLYHEARMLPVLRRALGEIDYPKDRLDVKMVLEADDEETLLAAKAATLPNWIEIVTVPPGEPRTKPKACNYALARARGEYVVIYDAEDIPETNQIKKAVVAFAKSDPEVACIQAKLSFYNRDQNWLTRWFTGEYSMWFDMLLPALQDRHMPIPLGGTSNHFRLDVLRLVGAWDPFNVTEDADLGMRLHKAGYRTSMIDSTTYEEANSEFVNWVRQRSRWIKGYIQTWLVHMRHPLRLWRSLGPVGFLGFQAVIGGTPFTLFMNPIYWALTTLWFLASWSLVPQLFPGWIYYLGMCNLALGNFAFAYLNMVACARRGHWGIVGHTLLAPAYWCLMSLAAWKAALQVVVRPSHWEKTEHGIVLGRRVTDLPQGQAASP